MIVHGFMKCRDEILTGHLPRALQTLDAIAEGGVLCDDASVDGTYEALEAWCAARPRWVLLSTKHRPELQGMANEMACKQWMMTELHARAAKEPPTWIYWLDADESIADPEVLLAFMRLADGPGIRQHYTQPWRSTSWARTDQGFDDGVFVKAWRYTPTLAFDTAPGTHKQQFPQSIKYDACPVAPIDVIHWGNATTPALVRKATQYSGGLGGVDRHIAFGHSPAESMASGVGFDQASWSAPTPLYRDTGLNPGAAAPLPKPFTLDEIRRIRAMGSLKREREMFAVVVPTYNRAADLGRALDSLIAQTYERWIALVIDDGSTDRTPWMMREYQERDPRIMYARYDENRGGVWANERGMDIACEMAEWWSRLGSDDWWGPNKLALDAKALREHEACYGLYTVVRGSRFCEICNPPMTPETIRGALLGGRYVVSWANIAMRCDVLRRIKAKHGHVMDLRLRNCDDFITNSRAVALGVDFVWRGPDGTDGTPVPLGVAWDSKRESGELEAVWTAAEAGGASSPENAAILARDEALTRQLIRELSQ